MLCFSSLTLSFKSINILYHERASKNQEGIEVSPVFQTILPVTFVNTFFGSQISPSYSYVRGMLMTDFHMGDTTFHCLSYAGLSIQILFPPPEL